MWRAGHAHEPAVNCGNRRADARGSVRTTPARATTHWSPSQTKRSSPTHWSLL